MKQFFKDFREFALQGNALNLAIGVVIGGAFGKIVSSFVSDIITPLLGLVTGGVDFSGLFYNLSSTPVENLAKAQESGIPVLAYGMFIQNVIDFLITAFAIFIALRSMMRFKKKEEEAPAKPARLCPYCKSEIADDATRCPHCTSEL
ncbi:MAG: large conductance mechanosensitive channel protein MscL [Synergistaceae bacterium]|nr:large conductance mechanosensitive channel protein MscL [Synergistaceae bacterium]